MIFFDCNVSYGILGKWLRPVRTINDVIPALESAGIQKAVVSRVDLIIGGNKSLAEDIKGINGLYGVWTLIPTHTGEIPDPETMLKLMKENKIIGWRLNPNLARFIPKVFVLRDWLEAACARQIPIFINTGDGVSLETLADLLEKFPELTVVLTYKNVWPSDRLLRPFVAEYPNVYLDMTYCFIEGAIESIAGKYGSGWLLYGSGFPECYFGANMLMIKHADISEIDKAAIAGENLSRIIAEVRYD